MIQYYHPEFPEGNFGNEKRGCGIGAILAVIIAIVVLVLWLKGGE